MSPISTFMRALLPLFLLSVPATMLHAQGGTITADPDAKQLRLLWHVAGNPAAGAEKIGESAGGLGDIYGTGKGAWAVHYGSLHEERIYRHGGSDITKDTTPVQTFHSIFFKLTGDFWGTGHRAVAFTSGSADTSQQPWRFYWELHVHRTESNRIDDNAATVFNGRTLPVKHQYGPDEVFAVDLNGDGADELVMAWGGTAAETGFNPNPELWIYKGGPDFNLAGTPTLVLRHPIPNGEVRVYAQPGDFDGDGHMDIALSRSRGDVRNHLTFFWGAPNFEMFGQPEHMKIDTLRPSGSPMATAGFVALDCDGDAVTDVAISSNHEGHVGTWLYRTRGTGRSARSRSFMLEDADRVFTGYSLPVRAGFLNDSARRYEMLGIAKAEGGPSEQPSLTLFAGGSEGPDLAYDAYSHLPLNHFPVPDVDGDGWDDYMGADPAANSNAGMAAIYAGGPYIPSPGISGVRALDAEGHAQALAVWPNPVADRLHIAWRGDLQRMPARFAVYDNLGREIACGNAAPGQGSVVWQCGNVPAGGYLLQVHDQHGTAIATTHVIKQ